MLSLIVAVAIFIPPLPPMPTEPPTGVLPWPVPSFPAVPTTTAPTIDLAEAEHSAGYDDQQEAIEDEISEWSQPVTEINTEMESWLGSGADLPDATGGDFDTGIAPVDDVGTAYEFASWLGTQMGTLFQYLRSITQLPTTAIGVLATVLIGCGAWLLFWRMITFGISIFDAAWSFGTTVIQTIVEIVPFW